MNKEKEACGQCGSADGHTMECAESELSMNQPLVTLPHNNVDPKELHSNCEKEGLPTKSKIIPYPVDALGNILGPAVNVIASRVQAPLEMVAQSVLSAASLICQAHVNVSTEEIGVRPISTYHFTVADSGERKSTADRLACKPIRDFEHRRMTVSEKHGVIYESQMQSWKMDHDKTIKYYKNKKAMTDDERLERDQELLSLAKRKPLEPEHPNMTLQEPTSAGIWRHFENGLPTAGLFTDEAVGFFGGHGMREESRGTMLQILSNLWDGDPIVRTRAERGESGVISGRRMSAHLQMQSVIANQVLTDELLMQQGFIARFQIVIAKSLVGNRFLQGRPKPRPLMDDPIYQRYHSELSRILAIPLPFSPNTQILEPATRRITGNAHDMWCELNDMIEMRCREDGEYIVIRATALKGSERIARLAAMFSFLEGESHILASHVQRAGELELWYLNSMAAHLENAKIDKGLLAASELLEWMRSHSGITTSDNFKSHPPKLRKAEVARKALCTLVERGCVEVLDKNVRGVVTKWGIKKAEL